MSEAKRYQTPAPFQTCILPEEYRKESGFKILFPATYRYNGSPSIYNRVAKSRADIGIPYEPGNVLDFLDQDLSVQEIEKLQRWIWLAGRPMPPRPLHYQLSRNRSIVVVEDMDHHMVWMPGQIFLKPLPPYLLHPTIWERYISAGNIGNQQLARGFLFSYTALIAYPSDFHIAKTYNLLPPSVTWEQWKDLCRELVQSHDYNAIHWRFCYGELRLTRLDKICKLRFLELRGYSSMASRNTLGDIISDNLAILAGALGYVVIVLTAMQLGLATDRLESSEAFQNASYGFTIFSILAPLIGGMVVFTLAMPLVMLNLRATWGFEKTRFEDIGVSSPRTLLTPSERVEREIAQA